MKQIGIISDTHSWLDPRVAEHFKECDEIWHAGDVGDKRVIDGLLKIAPTVRVVAGNIDIPSLAPAELTWSVEGISVFMTHIAPRNPATRLHERVDIVVTGHSHILKIYFDKQREVLCINPGAAGNYGWQPVPTLVRVKIDGDRIYDLEVIELTRASSPRKQ